MCFSISSESTEYDCHLEPAFVSVCASHQIKLLKSPSFYLQNIKYKCKLSTDQECYCGLQVFLFSVFNFRMNF